ncbi:MAG TPA: TonB-dependent receptor plug domain-containing protein [Bacteroidales bacterium]|nr:TonB-dependent receptor plug domain-containing protein [Bacteroidales bacterium]
MKKKTQSRQLLRFRRWSNKSYSIFNSLGKTVTIGTLAAVMVSQASTQVFGQTHHNPAFTFDSITKINEVEVDGIKPELLMPMVDAITIFTAQEIQRAGVQNLQDLLQFVQGLDLKTRGNEGVQADISYRGSTFDQIAILLNGINYTDPQTGHHNLNIPIIFSEIERIEILKGPGAWSAGSIAFAGAINIIYKEKSTGGNLKLSIGDHHYTNGEVTARISKNKFYILSGLNHSSSTGYINNTDFNINQFYAFAGFKDKIIGHFKFQLGFSAKDFGANSFYSLKYKDQYEETRSLISSLYYEKNFNNWRTVASVYYRQHHDMFRLFRYSAPSWYAGDNNHLTHVWGGNYQLAKHSKVGLTTISLDARSESILSTNLGDLFANPRFDFYTQETIFLKGKNRSHFSISLSHKFFVKKWILTLGIMESGNNDYGFKTYGGANIEYRIRPKAMINFYINNSYRLPTFTDLYYSSPSQIGNPFLKPEQTINTEISYQQTFKQFTFAGGVFYKYGFQLIDWVKLPDEEKWHSENLQNISTVGYDLSVRYAPLNLFVKKIDLNYTYLNITPIASEYQSLYVTDYLKHQINMTLDHDIYGPFSAFWMFSFNDRNGRYIDRITLEEHPYPNHLIVHLKISYSKDQQQIFIEISNLFNQKYFDYPHLLAPGRWIKGGVLLKF